MRETRSVAIRDATLADARAIAEVHVRSWQTAYRGELPDDYLDGLSIDERETQWKERLARPEVGVEALVAEDDGAVIGFAGFGPTRDEDAEAGTAEIYTLYLRPEWVGRGAGRDLFAASNERLEELGYTRATLWVLETNERSRRFYEAAGWQRDGTESTHQDQCLNMPIVRYAVEL
jgi:RimJ/RimL family protein N-acetyltransferase